MAIKVRLPNARYIKVNTDDPEYAKARAIEYYKSGQFGFVDQTTQTMATDFDREQFDYESGVQAPWLRMKLGAQETLGGKERVLEEAVGSDGFTRNSKGDLALTPRGLRKLGIKPKSNKYVVIDEGEVKSENYIQVDDVLDFLQKFARHHRNQFDIPFLGITGTNGKTTSKELINAVLSEKYKVHAKT